MTTDDEFELIYETDETTSDERSGPIDSNKVSVPRSVLYMQGVLLGVVALIAFALGSLFGSGRASPETDSLPSGPCVVAGRIQYVTAGRRQRPDEGSVIIMVPEPRRPSPNERSSIAGLRPLDPPAHADHAGIQAIRAMGGAYTRAGVQGEYQLRLPAAGEYFTLFISRLAHRESTEELGKSDLAQMGRYFIPATELLGDRQYRWRRVTVRYELTLDVEFAD